MDILEIKTLQKEIVDLKNLLKEREDQLHELQAMQSSCLYTSELSTAEVTRYSRQMLVPVIGIEGQIALKRSKVLIVGVGGLGCPAALYLVAGGVGEVTIIDNDEVELTNLHRQILHSEFDVGVKKVLSGFNTLTNINSDTKIIPLHMHLDGDGLALLLKDNIYNVIVDCTDNVATRYLVNDLCAINKIPLVSGSALQMEGQLTVYNYNNGPCYRCIFPVPPPPNTVTSCGDGGVLGVVPGIIGVLQALEVFKIVMNLPGVLSGRLLLFDATETTFRSVHLRQANKNCQVCGENPVITEPVDYEEFCGAKSHDKVENIDILKPNEIIGVWEFFNKVKDYLLIDVRPSLEYEMCHLPTSINIPFSSIEKGQDLQILKSQIEDSLFGNPLNVYLICRRGNDSQRAVCKLKEIFSNQDVNFINVAGGLHGYAKLVDPAFPIY